MAAALAGVVAHHVQALLGNMSRPALRWGARRHKFSGLSGVCYLMPLPFAPPLWCCLLVLTCVLSVMSDFVFTGRTSIAHGLDRWSATSMVVSLTTRAASLIPLWAVGALLVPPLVCFALSKYHSTRGMFDMYVLCHGLWHIVGGVNIALFFYFT